MATGSQEISFGTVVFAFWQAFLENRRLIKQTGTIKDACTLWFHPGKRPACYAIKIPHFDLLWSQTKASQTVAICPIFNISSLHYKDKCSKIHCNKWNISVEWSVHADMCCKQMLISLMRFQQLALLGISVWSAGGGCLLPAILPSCFFK